MGEVSCRRSIAERANNMCEKCGQARGTEAHHRKNRSQGGKWDVANMLLLCHLCHAWITTHPEEARAKGWAVRRHEDPEQVAVLIIGQWMLLKNNHTVEWTTAPKE